MMGRRLRSPNETFPKYEFDRNEGFDSPPSEVSQSDAEYSRVCRTSEETGTMKGKRGITTGERKEETCVQRWRPIMDVHSPRGPKTTKFVYVWAMTCNYPAKLLRKVADDIVVQLADEDQALVSRWHGRLLEQRRSRVG
ncbi:hypothetical protein PHMEG_00018087 [Phytophthora megakarya]|uniref:Uncharacterized protein n=1 Tax=Phytophthora megakarya TaxID=4795 RepID=A0A225VUX6_9STRA|nr:hypothetical protein PHMEG_00018087 [Phytophthora megakarya]